MYTQSKVRYLQAMTINVYKSVNRCCR